MIEIAGRKIGRECPPFIIAEMSGNHNQSLERALEIVEATAKTGVHALKIQTYTADTMTLDLNAVSMGTIITNIYLGGILWKRYVKLRN